MYRLPTKVAQPGVGLVIGAGGGCRAAIYALQSLRTGKIYLFNGTRGGAQALVDTFPDAKIVESLGSWSGSPPTIVISTVPTPATTTERNIKGSVYLPEPIFEARSGIVVDLTYKPAKTPLLSLTNAAGNGRQRVTGVEVLLEQGYVRFESWTGRRAPKKVVAEAVCRKFKSS